ncbi:MAG: DUF1343 domain-containing protein [Cyclobacteriaceae bacterium]
MIYRCFFLLALICACTAREPQDSKEVTPGAWQVNEYLSLLEGKAVAVTVNHSSLIRNTHLTDTLISLGINLKSVFTPEHGFKGTSSDGELVEYEEGHQSFKLISLHGKNKKPTQDQLNGIDLMVFDIQDVGARFYTYISTMHYVMEACAKANIPLIILDRPNPNGSYVDGPVLDTAYRSFVGMHPIPIVHGLTIGELAQMINGEGWLEGGIQCDLTVIKNQNWTHQTPYSLPVKPSPNLPDDLSISLYPGLCLFEQTIMSVGRGTDHAFQQIGHPEYPDTTYSFTPVSMEGAKWPPHENKRCFGISWIDSKPVYRFSLQPLLDAYKKMDRPDFFLDYFARLAGTDQLQKQIEAGLTEEEIRKTWAPDLKIFQSKRAAYLLYD